LEKRTTNGKSPSDCEKDDRAASLCATNPKGSFWRRKAVVQRRSAAMAAALVGDAWARRRRPMASNPEGDEYKPDCFVADSIIGRAKGGIR
jgi:hypothetical protein